MIQQIENSLIGMNGAKFQELCDVILSREIADYTAISRVGSCVGMQKTRKGTPDTFYRLSNGGYLFVEMTTASTDKRKLENDIKACFDTNKSKIPAEKIEGIILCFNWNISIEEIEYLDQLAHSFNESVVVKYYSLDFFTTRLLNIHKDLRQRYLGFPFDKGQIVNMDSFIDEYEKASSGLATPLTNKFLHREHEVEEFVKILEDSDIVIVSGVGGTGKTKFSIEAIKSFSQQYSEYSIYCISDKNSDMLEELSLHLGNKKCVLFVDDGSRINQLEQILSYWDTRKTGDLKIVITTRDYAKNDVLLKCQERQLKMYSLDKFTDDQIIDIIKCSPFDILNPDYHREIIKIAEGNPRLAIMAALLAKKKQTVSSMRNVGELFERYFNTFVRDSDSLNAPTVIRTMGLISFFYSLSYEDELEMKPILEQFGLTYQDFTDSIALLNRKELIQVDYSHVRIGEQNFAMYFFYKAFIKDKYLSFNVLLVNYFERFQNRFDDCIRPVNNTFDYFTVKQVVQPVMINYLSEVQEDVVLAFRFMESFWFYLQEESIAYIYQLILFYYNNNDVDEDGAYFIRGGSYFSLQEEIIKMLGNLLATHGNTFSAVVELAFKYCSLKPDVCKNLRETIRGNVAFDREDEKDAYQRQVDLLDYISKGVRNRDKTLTQEFFYLSKFFLSFSYQHFKNYGRNKIQMYDYNIPNVDTIQLFRKNIWELLDMLFVDYAKESLDVLTSYTGLRGVIDGPELMEFDISYICKLITDHLKPNDIGQCIYVHNQIRQFKRNGYSHHSFANLLLKFSSQQFEFYEKINWNRYRDKEEFEFRDYKEYNKLKAEEIRTVHFNDELDAKLYYLYLLELRTYMKNEWRFNESIDIMIDENSTLNFKLGLELFTMIAQGGNILAYTPKLFFENHLDDTTKVNQIWSVLNKKEVSHILEWRKLFFLYLEPTCITEAHCSQMLSFINEIKENMWINFNWFEKYTKIKADILKNLFYKITEKNENSDFTIQLHDSVFVEYLPYLGGNLDLIKKGYLQQVNCQMSLSFDYRWRGLLNIIQLDSHFLLEFIESILSKGDMFNHKASDYKLGVIWEIENKKVITEAFDLVVDKYTYLGILEHYCNVFFKEVSPKYESVARGFILDYIRNNFENVDKMKMVIDVVRNSRRDMFEEVLILILEHNQSLELFKKLPLRASSLVGTGHTIFGDIEANEWNEILSIVNKSKAGLGIIPIKQYLNERIRLAKKQADEERKKKFIDSREYWD